MFEEEKEHTHKNWENIIPFSSIEYQLVHSNEIGIDWTAQLRYMTCYVVCHPVCWLNWTNGIEKPNKVWMLFVCFFFWFFLAPNCGEMWELFSIIDFHSRYLNVCFHIGCRWRYTFIQLDLPKHNDLHGGIRPAVPHFGTNNVHKNSDASS